MLNTYKFDIIALSESWIKDNHHHLDYIKIPGYIPIFKNCSNKKWNWIGFHIREAISLLTYVMTY